VINETRQEQNPNHKKPPEYTVYTVFISGGEMNKQTQ